MFSLFGAFFEFLFVLRASLVLLCCSVSQKNLTPPIGTHSELFFSAKINLWCSLDDKSDFMRFCFENQYYHNTTTWQLWLHQWKKHTWSGIIIIGIGVVLQKKIYFGELNQTCPQSLDIADCPISPWSYIPFDGRYTFRLPLPCWYFYWQQSVLFPPLVQLPTSEVPPRHRHCNEINNSNNLDYKSHAQHHIPLHRQH